MKLACDPIGRLGGDVASVLAYKNPKTFLQELLLSRGGKTPNYHCERSTGSSDHDPVWICNVEIGGRLRITASASSKTEAEKRCAVDTLNAMEADRAWGPHLKAFKASALSKLAAATTVPMFTEPPHWLRMNLRAVDELRREISIDVDHRLLIAALTPRSIRAGGRFSNEALAFAGSPIFETFVHSGITSSGATSAQAYEALQLTLHLDTWVRRIYLRSADEFSKEQRIDLLQAVVASVFFTSGMDATLAWLSDCVEPKLSGMTTLNLKTAGLRPDEILGSVPQSYVDTLSFTILLQNYAHALSPALQPEYRYSARGPGHATVHECWATLQGQTGHGEGVSKKNAANRAAYELGRLLQGKRFDGRING